MLGLGIDLFRYGFLRRAASVPSGPAPIGDAVAWYVAGGPDDFRNIGAGAFGYPTIYLTRGAVITGPHTVSLWFQVTDVGTDYMNLFTQGTDVTGTAYASRLILTGNGSTLYNGVCAASESYLTAAVPAGGGWHHVVSAFDGTTLKLYLDGALIGSTPTAGGMLANTADPVYIGGHIGSPFMGNLDAVGVFDQALTAGEVAELWKGGDGAGLFDLSDELKAKAVAWWAMDTIYTADFPDVTGHGYTISGPESTPSIVPGKVAEKPYSVLNATVFVQRMVNRIVGGWPDLDHPDVYSQPYLVNDETLGYLLGMPYNADLLGLAPHPDVSALSMWMVVTPINITFGNLTQVVDASGDDTGLTGGFVLDMGGVGRGASADALGGTIPANSPSLICVTGQGTDETVWVGGVERGSRNDVATVLNGTLRVNKYPGWNTGGFFYLHEVGIVPRVITAGEQVALQAHAKAVYNAADPLPTTIHVTLSYPGLDHYYTNTDYNFQVLWQNGPGQAHVTVDWGDGSGVQDYGLIANGTVISHNYGGNSGYFSPTITAAATGYTTGSAVLGGVNVEVLPVYGCTDPSAMNYNPSANIDDGSCVAYVYGCTDPAANNYNPSANTDDGSCTYD